MVNFFFALRRSLLPRLSQDVQNPTGLATIKELEGGNIVGIFVNELLNHGFQSEIKSLHLFVCLLVVDADANGFNAQ